jgi:hypothetical protein
MFGFIMSRRYCVTYSTDDLIAIARLGVHLRDKAERIEWAVYGGELARPVLELQTLALELIEIGRGF